VHLRAHGPGERSLFSAPFEPCSAPSPGPPGRPAGGTTAVGGQGNRALARLAKSLLAVPTLAGDLERLCRGPVGMERWSARVSAGVQERDARLGPCWIHR